jgi:hypothetical protein
MVTGNGKCDCIFRAHLIFFLFFHHFGDGGENLFSKCLNAFWIYIDDPSVE